MEINKEQRMELIKSQRPTIKESTMKQYEAQLRKLAKLFDSPDNYEFLTDVDAVMDKISHLHYTSQRNALNPVIVLLLALNEDKKYDELIKSYSKIRDGFNLKYEEEQKSGKISEKQKGNFVEMDAIDEMLNKMEKEIRVNKLKKKAELTGKEKELFMVFTLFNWLKRIPTRNDMAGQILINKSMVKNLTEEEKKNTNYLVKEKSKMYGLYNDYKTSSKYGEKIIEIPKDLEKIINVYIRATNKKVGDVLFVNSMGTPLNRNQISQLLIKTSKLYLQKNISTTIMRKIVASYHFGDKEYQEKKKEQAVLAHNMGHSTSVQDKVYIKTTD